METSADEETIHQLFATFRDSGFHFKDLLMGLVKAPQFLAGLEDTGSGVVRTRVASVSPSKTNSMTATRR
jgi:hypothetical protein